MRCDVMLLFLSTISETKGTKYRVRINGSVMKQIGNRSAINRLPLSKRRISVPVTGL